MVGLLALLVTIWTLVSANLAVTQFDGPVHFTDLYGNARTAEAALACPAGEAPILLLSDRFSTPRWSMSWRTPMTARTTA